jgi:hypothetical protein
LPWLSFGKPRNGKGDEIATPPFERLAMAKAARSPLLPLLVALFQVEKNNCISKEKNKF